MKQEEKSALSRQRILDAAMEEFSAKGYDGASLNTVWAEKGISKGIVYHHFKDKDSLYLGCVGACFAALTRTLQKASAQSSGSAEDRLRDYFDARLRFFSANPVLAGLFMDASFRPPVHLRGRLTQLRQPFDDLNVAVLTDLLRHETLRPGLSAAQVADDFRLYMDYFNIHFGMLCRETAQRETLLRTHEDQCHRQLDILLHGVLEQTER